MKQILRLTTTLIVLLFMGGNVWGQTSYTSASVSTAWNDSRWNNTSDAAPYTAEYTANNKVIFTSGSYSFAGMGAAINVGDIDVASGANVTFTVNANTFATGGNVRTITVASGSTIDFSSQGFSTASGTGFIKEGEGTMNISTGGTYGGGFTLNAGTMIIGGVNALGSGGALNINGGTLAASATKTITTKYSGINIGGDFILGNTDNNKNLGFDDAVSLGSNATRTITLGSIATYSLSGAISGENANLSLNATAAGTLVLSGANTYNGTTTVSGGTLKLALIGGNTLPATNNIVVDGGTLQISTNQTLNDLTFTNGTITIDADIILTINGILDCGTNSISGSGSFTLSSGATLKTAHSSGLDGSIAVSGPKSFDVAANYEFNGSSAQVTGALLPAEVNNIAISNVAGVKLSNDGLKVNGIMTIISGDLFTLESGKQLTVSGTLTNNAGNSGLVIASDATGTGSLIHNSANVNATVQRYFTGSYWDWHLISSPVIDQAIQNEFVPADFMTSEDFYTWYEPSNIYVNYKNSSEAPTWATANTDNNFIEGKGYLIAYEDANLTKEFTGLLNNGEQSVAITKTGSDTYSGSNLVGNPYASSIDWKAASGWTRTSLVSSSGGYDMYIWNESENNFGTFNSAGTSGTNSVTRYIPPMQGFFVNASTSGNLIMNNEVRVHNGASNWLKNIETNIALFKIKVNSAGNYGSDEAIIEYGHEDATGGAAKMFSFVPTAPSIYLPKAGNDYSISFLSAISETEIVPLNFKAGTDGTYSLEFVFDVDTFNIVELRDMKTNIKTNLRESQIYEFMASTEDSPNRFELHFGAVSISEQDQASTLNAYVYNNRLYINNSLEKAQLAIYDLQGRMVLQQAISEAGLQSLPLNLPAGMYVLQLSNAQEAQSVKINVQ